MNRLDEFQHYYIETKDFVRTSIYWMVRSSIVDDIVQEAYVKAWKSFSTFKRESSFKTWIYRIAMNTTYDYFKSNKSERKMLDHLSEQKLIQDKDQAEYEQLISEGIKLLSLDQREIFFLHYRLGYTFSECANIIQEQESTIKSRLYKAKDIFVTFLKENGVFDERSTIERAIAK